MHKKRTKVNILLGIFREGHGLKKIFFIFFLIINLLNFLLIKIDEGFNRGNPSLKMSNSVLAVSSFGAAPGGLLAIQEKKSSLSLNQTGTELEETLKYFLAQNVLLYLLIFLRPSANRKKEHRHVSYNNGRF